MKTLFFAALITLCNCTAFFGQDLYMPRNVKNAFKAETRSPDGKPGKNYWQNKAKYNISINVAPPNRTVSGTEEVVYTNNSPQPIDSIVFRLTMNSHQPEAPREFPVSTDYLTSGIHIDEFTENGKAKKWEEPLGLTFQGIALDKPLAPRASVTFTFKWHYDVSKKSGREGAIDESTFFLAYFYPRIAVFDDVDGWDMAFFTEGHEFYNDFNDYTFQVTAPKNFIVWATGDLLNPTDTLQPKFAARFKESFSSDAVIHVATAAELAAKSVTAQTPTVTWKWKADNVSDIAMAVSDHYIWDAGSVVVDKSTNRRASVQAAYNIEAKDFEKMVEYGKHALDWTSNNFPGTPYPFQKTTIVRGYADMEYPMMVNDSSQEDPNFTRFIVEHEILHSWFPFHMGINEQRYGFMDEGWTTAFENLIGRADLGQEVADTAFKGFRVSGWIENPTADGDLPIISPGDGMTGQGFGNNQYGKAALGYLALKDLLGDAEFKRTLHVFIDRWHGKRPLPWDMFNTFNNASGKNLNWFFNNWFFSIGYIDLGIKEVRPSENSTRVVLSNTGGFCAPVDLIVTYDDATTARLHQTPVIWIQNQKETTVEVPSKKKVTKLTLDGGIFMDANLEDNRWATK